MLDLSQKSQRGEMLKDPLNAYADRIDVAERWLHENVKSGQRKVHCEMHRLTIERAQVLLKHNESNRRIHPDKLAQIVSDIKSGNWLLNGETIIVADNGMMNDGQHRCLSVIEAGVPVDTLIAFGVGRGTRTTVDVGTARTVGDQISMEGGDNANLGGAIAKMLVQFEKTGKISSQFGDAPTTATQRAKYWECYDEIMAALHCVPKQGSARVGAKSFIVFVVVLLRRKNVKAAERFIEGLCTAAINKQPVPPNSPIFQARERLSDPAAKRLKTMERLEIVLRHWNAYLANKKMSKSSPLQGKLPEIEG